MRDAVAVRTQAQGRGHTPGRTLHIRRNHCSHLRHHSMWNDKCSTRIHASNLPTPVAQKRRWRGDEADTTAPHVPFAVSVLWLLNQYTTCYSHLLHGTVHVTSSTSRDPCWDGDSESGSTLRCRRRVDPAVKTFLQPVSQGERRGWLDVWVRPLWALYRSWGCTPRLVTLAAFVKRTCGCACCLMHIVLVGPVSGNQPVLTTSSASRRGKPSSDGGLVGTVLRLVFDSSRPS
jgi:hypothetical protein